MIVDPDAAVISRLRPIGEAANYVVSAHTRFEAAREALADVDLGVSAVVTNIRLGEFNGIHLVYIAKLYREEIRALVYSRTHDAILALEAQRAGAFYQRQGLLPSALAGFLRAGLPSNDRRAAASIDRRMLFRGGRRSTDAVGPDLAFGQA